MGDLPGVGWQMQKKLEKLGLPSVADVRNSRRELLQRELGAKSGSMASPLLPSGLLSPYCAVAFQPNDVTSFLEPGML